MGLKASVDTPLKVHLYWGESENTFFYPCHCCCHRSINTQIGNNAIGWKRRRFNINEPLGYVYTELLAIALALAMHKMTLSSIENFYIANSNGIANAQCEHTLRTDKAPLISTVLTCSDFVYSWRGTSF